MGFEVDKNTLRDLDIDIYVRELFRNTRTVGARILLESLVQEPSNDSQTLSERRDAFEYFIRQPFALDVTNNQVDFIEFYLGFNKRYLRDNIADAAFDYVRNRIDLSADYYTIRSGIEHIILLLKKCIQISAYFQDCEAPVLLNNLFQPLDSLIANPAINRALLRKRLKFTDLNHLDKLFRKVMIRDLRELLAGVYLLDLFETVSDYARMHGWTLPQGNTEPGRIEIFNFFHPGVAQPVRNTFVADQNSRLTILTGPNTSGKSVFLKSIALCIYLAHLGFPVPAERMCTSVFSGLITTINLPDSVGDGHSHYYGEIQRLAYIAEQVRQQGSIVVIIDELFRGTNPQDALEASHLVLNELKMLGKCVFLVSTHLTDLAGRFDSDHQLTWIRSEANRVNGHLHYTYQIKEGVSTERSGMDILYQKGLIELLKRVRDCV